MVTEFQQNRQDDIGCQLEVNNMQQVRIHTSEPQTTCILNKFMHILVIAPMGKITVLLAKPRITVLGKITVCLPNQESPRGKSRDVAQQ